MKLTEYMHLIRSYLNGDLEAIEFGRRYSLAVTAERRGTPRTLFSILENLLEDIESYSPNWTVEDEQRYFYKITERTLRAEAANALAQLDQYLRDHPDALY